MNCFDLLDDDTGVVNGNTLSDLKDYIEASTIDYEDDDAIHYTYCPASMLKELFNLSDDEIFELVLPLGYHICQLFGDCEYESEDYYIVKDEESVNKLISDCENYLDFTPSYEIIPNVAYDECLKEAKNKEKPTKNQLKDWAKKHKKSDKKNAWGWWVFPNVEGSINFFNRAMGSTSASGTETSGNLTGTSTRTSSAGSTSAGVGESLTEDGNNFDYKKGIEEYERTLKKLRDRLKNESVDKLLSEINIETTVNLPQGSSFILPDGNFIDVEKIANDEYALHSDAIREIMKRFFQLENDNKDTYIADYDALDMVYFVIDELGWIECGVDEKSSNNRYY